MTELNLRSFSPLRTWKEVGAEVSKPLITWLAFLITSPHPGAILHTSNLNHLISIQKTLLLLRKSQGF